MPDTPQSLGDMIDERRRLKDAKAIAQTTVDNIEDQITALEHQILGTMAAAGLTTAAGSIAKAAIVKEDVPNVNDWNQLYEFIKTNDAFYLLQKRMSATAFRDTAAAYPDGIPGVTAVPRTKLSITNA